MESSDGKRWPGDLELSFADIIILLYCVIICFMWCLFCCNAMLRCGFHFSVSQNLFWARSQKKRVSVCGGCFVYHRKWKWKLLPIQMNIFPTPFFDVVFCFFHDVLASAFVNGPCQGIAGPSCPAHLHWAPHHSPACHGTLSTGPWPTEQDPDPLEQDLDPLKRTLTLLNRTLSPLNRTLTLSTAPWPTEHVFDPLNRTLTPWTGPCPVLPLLLPCHSLPWLDVVAGPGLDLLTNPAGSTRAGYSGLCPDGCWALPGRELHKVSEKPLLMLDHSQEKFSPAPARMSCTAAFAHCLLFPHWAPLPRA